MTYYMFRGSRVHIVDSDDIRVDSELPPKTYLVRQDPNSREYFLQSIDDFSVPTRLFGTVGERVERIYSTFERRDQSTGALLLGDKGSGKTLIGKLLSRRAAEDGIPTLVVNAAYRGDGFNEFIQNIEQPAVVVFDEFEKVYKSSRSDSSAQDELLTLFDGVFRTKKLFIVTANDVNGITDKMFNRPGRAWYRYDYEGLDEAFIREYCEAVLDDATQIENVLVTCICLGNVNFDSLQALTQEMNARKETATESLRHINVRPEGPSPDARYTARAFDARGAEVSSCIANQFGMRSFAIDFGDIESVYLEVDIGAPEFFENLKTYLKASNEGKLTRFTACEDTFLGFSFKERALTFSENGYTVKFYREEPRPRAGIKII